METIGLAIVTYTVANSEWAEGNKAPQAVIFLSVLGRNTRECLHMTHKQARAYALYFFVIAAVVMLIQVMG